MSYVVINLMKKTFLLFTKSHRNHSKNYLAMTQLFAIQRGKLKETFTKLREISSVGLFGPDENILLPAPL